MTFIAYVFPKKQAAENMVRKMSPKPRFRTSFDNQQSKGTQTLLKSARQHFYHIFSITLKEMELKNVYLNDVYLNDI